MNRDRQIHITAKYLELVAAAIRHVEAHQRDERNERQERVYVAASPMDFSDLLNSLKDHLKAYRCEDSLQDLIAEELWMENHL